MTVENLHSQVNVRVPSVYDEERERTHMDTLLTYQELGSHD